MIENRIYNFSAGPSMLAESVLKKAQEQMLNYEGSGMSVMEMSHRSKVYDKIITDTEALFHEVMGIPDDYKVLFLAGGATGMFAAIPMNLAVKGNPDYVVTGNFAGGSFKEAKKYAPDAKAAADLTDENFVRIPQQSELKLNPDADYVHICFNNTIFGTKWNYIPETGNVPLVADMSSCILSEPVDVTKFDVIYAGAQKNIAPAGVTIVIVKKSLLGNAKPITPKIWNFATETEKDSMLNTPPCYSIYIAMLVLQWIRDEIGGLENMQKRNIKKASALYDYLDSTDFYKTTVEKNSRSMMNVVFRTGNDDLDAKFVKESQAAGMSNLKGHRLVGGMRASIYNAMPQEGVEYLIDFMKKFEAANK